MFITSCTILGARPCDGSSNSTSPGEPSKARAIATICISPPERFSHSRCSRYSSGLKMSNISPSCQLRKRVFLHAMDRLRSTVSVGKIRRSSGTHPTPARVISCVAWCVTSTPSKLMRPRLAGVNPRIERKVVVLPAPLAPSSPTTSPSSTASDTPNSAWVSP